MNIDAYGDISVTIKTWILLHLLSFCVRNKFGAFEIFSRVVVRSWSVQVKRQLIDRPLWHRGNANCPIDA